MASGKEPRPGEKARTAQPRHRLAFIRAVPLTAPDQPASSRWSVDRRRRLASPLTLTGFVPTPASSERTVSPLRCAVECGQADAFSVDDFRHSSRRHVLAAAPRRLCDALVLTRWLQLRLDGCSTTVRLLMKGH